MHLAMASLLQPSFRARPEDGSHDSVKGLGFRIYKTTNAQLAGQLLIFSQLFCCSCKDDDELGNDHDGDGDDFDNDDDDDDDDDHDGGDDGMS